MVVPIMLQQRPMPYSAVAGSTNPHHFGTRFTAGPVDTTGQQQAACGDH